MGLISFNVDTGKLALIGWPFYVHLFLVTCLIAYFPWSKLMHLGGVFLSPTRNLANNNRTVRHAIPWTAEERSRVYPNWGKVHHYHEWEEEFRDKIEACGLPMDKE